MNFADVRFWEILLVTLAVALAVRAIAVRREEWRATYDRLALLVTGLVLLLAVSLPTFLIYLAVSLGTYAGLALILRLRPRRPVAWLSVLVPLQLGPLLYFKYADFLANRVLGGHFSSLAHLVIPVGISFYTFQKVAFSVDTLVHKQPLPRLLDYMNFAGFFPQIVAGPIERRDSLLPQVEDFRFRWSACDLNAGASWIALGLFFKCCLADNLAGFFDGSSTSNAWAIWTANLLFGLRIYYDFAGYSLVALGLARCLGVTLTLNFASPYCSTSVGEFWRRWHITLSQWFRDYVYLPLGGSRMQRWWLNILIVFVLSGIWHGAGWNFLAWGSVHGALLIAQRVADRRQLTLGLFAWPVTMVAVFFSWLAFYETDASRLFTKIGTLLHPTAYSLANLRAVPQQWSAPVQFTIGCFALLTGLTLLLEWRSVARGGEPFSLLRKPPILVLLVILTVLLASHEESAFIYFAF